MNYGRAARQMILAVLGSLIYVIGVNWFISPFGFYTGGLMGVCQLIGTVLVDFVGIRVPFDLTGVIYYAINIPVFIVGYIMLGKKMLLSTLITTTAMSVFFSVIPVLPVSPIGDDPLASCIFGGVITGYGVGLYLQMGSSAGGLDLIGLIIAKKKSGMSLGKVNLVVNMGLYLCCMFIYDMSIALYSVMIAAVCMLVMDKTHYQNIDVEVHIISQSMSVDMKTDILETMNRGITILPAHGAWTGNESEVLYMLVNKYEVNHLKEVVYRHDPKAFVVVNEGVKILTGHYLKKL